MLALLEQQARAHADAVAYLLPDRVITYRRCWSRIERASARLQGEWGVARGDLVAYVGHGHPDALILYLALARLGASLLPLEALASDSVQAALASQPVTLVVHDEGTIVDAPATRLLRDLLEHWCHHDPECLDEAHASSRLLIRSEQGQLQSLSMDHLLSAMAPEVASVYVGERIFSLPVLSDVILPALHAAQELKFAATERGDSRTADRRLLRTGS
jgi:acyl-CoA synthetase (AMP-forming)/AMP-acid ligase II